ncbi:MAG: biotin transporter BioY [Candidatus Omnitrophica bacterium]|nr:biotin transporter BioY [Candidatus Omnitrophota bacterium]
MRTLEITKEILIKDFIVDKNLSKLIGLISFIVLTALGAFVRIPLPFTPVPITLQTFFVLLAAAFLGRSWGTFSQLGYLALGILGLPIFSNAASGLLAISGPTGGYLFGFVFGSWLIGHFMSRTKVLSFARIFMVMSLGLAVIYVWGCLWLEILFKLGLRETLMLGFWPFLPGAVLKLSAASFIYSKMAKRAGEIFG